jgi:guanylate kinase
MQDLSEVVASYQLPDHAAELIRSTKIVLLAGITSAGKDTIKKELLKKPEFRDIVSHTTRAPRTNNGVMEVDGLDYHFIDQTEAERMLGNEEFIEAKFVHGTIYGTSVRALQEIHNEGRVAITDLDVQGVAEYKKISQNVVAIFVLPPSYDIWLQRLEDRYGVTKVSQEEWEKRRDSAIRELSHALLTPYYHFVINDRLEQAVSAVLEITSHPTDEFHSKDDEARIRARELLQAIKENV